MNRPNILLIVVHDLGTHLGCYGWDRCLSTHNLDTLADEGVRFANHFATAPFCSPSRGSIITGKYPHTNGLMGLVNLGWDLPSSNKTLGRVLGAAGYETFLFGHQHEVKDHAQLGFDHVSDRERLSCDAVAPMVAEFLKERNGDGKPFYARVGFTHVHRPFSDIEDLSVSPEQITILPYLEDTQGLRDDLVMFYAVVQHMDRSAGTILDALEQTGLKDNTIVIFTTDHGIAFPRAKATLYDSGINTALLMRWPDGFNGGKVVSELISNIDVFPTLLDAAGVPTPAEVQGRSFLPLLRHTEYTPNSMIFAEKNTHPGDIKRCVRTGRHKYIRNYDEGPLLRLPVDIEVSLTRQHMGDAHLAPRPAVELYDLEKDPHEKRNLAGNPEYADAEKDLSSKLQAFLEQTDDPVVRGGVQRPSDEERIIRNICEEKAMQRSFSLEEQIYRRYREIIKKQNT